MCKTKRKLTNLNTLLLHLLPSFFHKHKYLFIFFLSTIYHTRTNTSSLSIFFLLFSEVQSFIFTIFLQLQTKANEMERTKGSSSKRPHIEEETMPEPEEENLSKNYEANFPILSHEECATLTKIMFREILGCKYISNSLLNNVGMFDEIDKMLQQSGLKKFVSMHEDTYVDLIIEFYTTLSMNATNSKILELKVRR